MKKGVIRIGGEVVVESVFHDTPEPRRYAQATGQGEFEIFAENDTRFFARVAAIVLTFGDMADGQAGNFMLEQNGVKRTAWRAR